MKTIDAYDTYLEGTQRDYAKPYQRPKLRDPRNLAKYSASDRGYSTAHRMLLPYQLAPNHCGHGKMWVLENYNKLWTA